MVVREGTLHLGLKKGKGKYQNPKKNYLVQKKVMK